MLARRAHHSPRAKTVQCPRRPACRAIFSVGRSAFCIPFPPPRRTSLRACASAPLPSSVSLLSLTHTLLNPFLNLLFILVPQTRSHARTPARQPLPVLLFSTYTHTYPQTLPHTHTLSHRQHPIRPSPLPTLHAATCCFHPHFLAPRSCHQAAIGQPAKHRLHHSVVTVSSKTPPPRLSHSRTTSLILARTP